MSYFSTSCAAYVGTGATSTSGVAGVLSSEFYQLLFPVSANISASPASICANDTVSFSQTSSNAILFSWDFGDGQSSSDTSLIVNHPYATAGQKTVTLIASNGCASDTDTTSITVNSLPTVTAGPDTSICMGSSVMMHASGGASYIWTPNTDLDKDTGASVTAMPSTSIQYTVNVSTAAGCISSGMVSITVMPLPSVSMTASVSSVCQNGTISFTQNSSNATGFAWAFGDGQTSSDASPVVSHLYTVAGTHMVTLVASNNCSSDTDTAFVTVHSLPIVAAQPDTSICAGSSVALQASGAASYSWAPSADLSSDTGSSVTATPSASSIYSVTGTSLDGCSATDVVSITVQPVPSASVLPAGPVGLCGGSSATLTANTGAGLTYQWYANNVAIPGANSFQYSVTSQGSYQVLETNAANCSSYSNAVIVQAGSSGISVQVNVSPSIGCGPNTIYLGYGPTSLTLTAVAPGAVSYLWSTGETTSSIQVSTPDTYHVTVTDAAGCISQASPSSTVEIFVVDIRCGHGSQKVQLCHVPPGNPGNPQSLCIAPSAVEAHLRNHPGDCLGTCPVLRLAEPFSSRLSVYPNPTTNTFDLHLSGEETNLEVRDISGRLCARLSPGNTRMTIGSEWAPGVYLLQWTENGETRSLKLVKTP